MRTFDSLDADFRRAFKQAAKQGIVKFTIEGIKDDPESIYPMFEVSNNPRYLLFRAETRECLYN